MGGKWCADRHSVKVYQGGEGGGCQGGGAKVQEELLAKGSPEATQDDENGGLRGVGERGKGSRGGRRRGVWRGRR